MMDNELLSAFVGELDALRVEAGEFAKAYPDVATELDIGAYRSSDAQVERVIEAVAFLAARLRLMIEKNATELPLSMLSVIAPNLVEPVPSFAVVELEGGADALEIRRDTRFDARLGAGSLACFSAAMNVTVAPMEVRTRRLDATAGYPDGIGVQVIGRVPSPLTLHLGTNERNAAPLMDAITESLAEIEVMSEGAEPVRFPARQLRIRGFGRDDAALPVRPATHPAHRVVTEFLVFPGKFRFVTLDVEGLNSGDEIRFRFTRPMAFPGQVDADLISVNRLPVVNLWRTVSAPVDVDGRRLEYPVRVAAPRYRAVECHSVESLDVYQGGQTAAQRLDPVFGFGNLRGTAIQWGTRRTTSGTGSGVLLYFRGLDYGRLGRQQLLATGNVLASNGDIAQNLQIGTPMPPVDPAGGWQGRLVSTPTPYMRGLDGANALEMMIGYLNSGMVGLVGETRRGVLQDYLRRFPGGRRAAWIEGLSGVEARPVMTTRGRQQIAGVGLVIGYDASSYPGTSRGMVKRVLGQLFDSQRGLNRVEELEIDAS